MLQNDRHQNCADRSLRGPTLSPINLRIRAIHPCAKKAHMLQYCGHRNDANKSLRLSTPYPITLRTRIFFIRAPRGARVSVFWTTKRCEQKHLYCIRSTDEPALIIRATQGHTCFSILGIEIMRTKASDHQHCTRPTCQPALFIRAPREHTCFNI